jgi:transcriptional regulator with XRE-family HTH domain
LPKKSPVTKRLKEARLEAGISQKELGIAAGIDEFVASARMNQYETGKHAPDFGIINKVSDVLHVPPAYFYTQDDDLAHVLKMYVKLNKKERVQLIAYMKRLSE